MIRDKATGMIRISKEAQAKIRDLSAKTGLNSAALLDHFLNISDQSSLPTPVSPPPAPDSPIKKKRREQPSQGLIDAFIMNVWGLTSIRLPDQEIQQGLSLSEWGEEIKSRDIVFQSQLEKLPKSISRKTIIDETYKALALKGWNTIFPNWARTRRDNHGDYQVLIDKRLSALVLNLYLTRGKGIYTTTHIFPSEINLIAGIINLLPQKGLRITRLLKRERYQNDTYRDYQNK